MNYKEKKETFLESANEAANGKDGQFEFTCPICDGYAIGERKSYFSSILASCVQCGFVARGEINLELQKGA